MIVQCYLGSFVMSFLLYVSQCQLRQWTTLLSRSKCENCQSTLTWWMLVPIFSYIILKGRCYKCRIKIPKYLFIGECLGAIMSYLILKLNFQIEYVYLFLISFILLTISLIDIQNYIVPNRLLLLLVVLIAFLRPTHITFSILTCLCISVLLLIGFTFPSLIGFGDIKLLIILFFILPVPFVIYVIWITFPIAAILYPFYAAFLSSKKFIPLVPFITLSFFIVAYYYPMLNVWFGGVR